MYRIASGEELTITKLDYFLNQHIAETRRRLIKMEKAYKTDYKILHAPRKPDWKPDNRIAVNFAKYITDTMNGFFIGNGVKMHSDDESTDEKLQFINAYNDVDDLNAEVSKMCDIYGRGYEIYYIDNDGEVAISKVSPIEGFMVYDDSILSRPVAFVRVYKDPDGVIRGSVSDKRVVRYFERSPELHYVDEEHIHGFQDVPATEFKENEEEMGIFEPVMTMIDAYNKAISEKANDVDYFADAYMKILGAKLSNDELQQVRRNRIINFAGQSADGLVVDFLQKPDADGSQEHLIDRLEKLIFQISMVANISDENFGTSSGIALKYKLLAMNNLAKTKERKFVAAFNNRYRIIFSSPTMQTERDSWATIDYRFNFNYPANLVEESEIAKNLAGIASKDTQLKVLSIVDDIEKEKERIAEDTDPLAYNTEYPTNRV